MKFLFSILATVIFVGLNSCQQEEVLPVSSEKTPLSTKARPQIIVAVKLNIPEGYNDYFNYPCVGYLYSQYEEKTYINFIPDKEKVACSVSVEKTTLFSLYVAASELFNSWNSTRVYPYNFTIEGKDYVETRPFDKINYSDSMTGPLGYYALFNALYDEIDSPYCTVTINYKVGNGQ